MRHAAAILLTSWVLVGSPAFCQAGLIEHICGCADCGADCPDSECPATSPESDCPEGHACYGDPCDAHVIRPRLVETGHVGKVLPQPCPLACRPAELSLLAPASSFCSSTLTPVHEPDDPGAHRSLPLLV